MRISDWSSDVCSSDLARRLARNRLSSSQTRPLRRVRTTRAISNQRIDVPLEPGFGIGSWEFGRSDLRVFRLSRQNHHGGGCCASPIPNTQSPLHLSCCNTTRKASCAISTRSDEHTSELQSLMRITYAVFCLKYKNTYQ